jgi:hypothetical protein
LLMEGRRPTNAPPVFTAAARHRAGFSSDKPPGPGPRPGAGGTSGRQTLQRADTAAVRWGTRMALMNKVIEARKAADANLITRREETAAMRSQANTARILENNPTLMRLRELDVLEKIAEKSKLNVVLGEKGLADRMVNLL